MKFSTLTALATVMATLALPAISTARDRDDDKGRGNAYGRDKDRRDDAKNRGRSNEKRNRKDRGNDDRRGDRDRDDRGRDDRNRDDRNRDDRNRDGRDGRYDNGGRYEDGANDGGYDDRNGTWNDAERRQRTKNEWRDIAIASGAVGVLGLLKNDRTLTFVGAAGALYSTYRYEQDRKSQNSLDRARAAYFSRPEFYRDGIRYERRTVDRNGERKYQFVRAR